MLYLVHKYLQHQFFVPDPKPESKGDSKDKKRKSPEEEIFEDDDFDSMMQDIDFDDEIGKSKIEKLQNPNTLEGLNKKQVTQS